MRTVCGIPFGIMHLKKVTGTCDDPLMRFKRNSNEAVTSAKAGGHPAKPQDWIPAFTGITTVDLYQVARCLRFFTSDEPLHGKNTTLRVGPFRIPVASL